MKLKTINEYYNSLTSRSGGNVNEGNYDIKLLFTPTDKKSAAVLKGLIDDNDFEYYANYNSRENYFEFECSSSDDLDALELKLSRIFGEYNINGYFETE
jgi:hypothetical protein